MSVYSDWLMSTVYPRVRGGTSPRRGFIFADPGLSPRARGNLLGDAGYGGCVGSIPACAGEPRAGYYSLGPHAVYPRVRGGTLPPNCSPTLKAGLSPRARGNPVNVVPTKLQNGSIPACAGEPDWMLSNGVKVGVYPRVRGGTLAGLMLRASAEGLSPRARGNPSYVAGERGAKGSIPACAGEPKRNRGCHETTGVYPRVRGGTQISSAAPEEPQGLSPRARGNP